MGKKKNDLIGRNENMSDDLIQKTFDDHERRIRLLEDNNKILMEINFEVKNMKQDIGEINKKLASKEEAKQKDIKGWITFLLQAAVTILIGYIAIKLGLK